MYKIYFLHSYSILLTSSRTEHNASCTFNIIMIVLIILDEILNNIIGYMSGVVVAITFAMSFFKFVLFHTKHQ